MTIESALITAVASLAGVVGAMGLWFKAQFSHIEAKLTECEDDRIKLWEKLATLGVRSVTTKISPRERP